MKKCLLMATVLANFLVLTGCASDYDHVPSNSIGFKINCSDGSYVGRSGRCANDPAGSSLSIEVQ